MNNRILRQLGYLVSGTVLSLAVYGAVIPIQPAKALTQGEVCRALGIQAAQALKRGCGRWQCTKRCTPRYPICIRWLCIFQHGVPPT
jgi:hypothetical protein